MKVGLISYSQIPRTLGGGIEKIRVLITHRSHTILQLVPGLIEIFGGTPKTQVVGISVIEPVNE